MADYTSLQNDVAKWSLRSDLGSLIPSFIALAEDEIFRMHVSPLRVREMETEADLTVTSLTATLPEDFLEARYIKQDNATRDTMFYFPPESWKPSSSGYFTIVGDKIRLPTGMTSNLKLVYYALPDPLATTSTNTILTKYYAAYLEASLKFAYTYLRDAAKIQAAQMALDTYLATANLRNKPASAGGLRVRAA